MFVCMVKIRIVLCKILMMVKTYTLVLYFVKSYSPVFELQIFEGPYCLYIRGMFAMKMQVVDIYNHQGI
jgi:hypothetical protein